MRAPNTSTSYGDANDDPQRRARWSGLSGLNGLTGWRSQRADTPDTQIADSADTTDITNTTAASAIYPYQREQGWAGTGMGSATALHARPYMPYTAPGATQALDPDVWLIALPNGAGGMRSLEGAGRPGAIRVSRPYGHLRTIRPITPLSVLAATDASAPQDITATDALDADYSGPLGAAVVTDGLGPASADRPGARRGRAGTATATRTTRTRKSARATVGVPAQRPAPQIISAVEVETDSGIFRVERPDSVLDNSDMAWALAHMEQGEPDSVVALPRRQLALLLTLLPTPEDPEQPEKDPHWGWAHKLRGPWERGPLHPKGRLGRLIAIDPDLTGQGMHRACFELLGSDDVVWALGVPCFRQGSVYELTPMGKNSLSRWLTWPVTKIRKRAGATGFERPEWEIARVVYRVGHPRWPLAGVVEPLGPMGTAG